MFFNVIGVEIYPHMRRAFAGIVLVLKAVTIFREKHLLCFPNWRLFFFLKKKGQ